MKHLYLKSLLFGLLLTACNKRQPVTPLAGKFVISGANNVTTVRDTVLSIPFWLENEETNSKDSIVLWTEVTPPDLACNLPVTRVIPPSQATLEINVSADALPGTYPIFIRGSRASGHYSRYQVNLTVGEKVSNFGCVARMTGIYTTIYPDSYYNSNYIEIIRDSVRDQLLIKDWPTVGVYHKVKMDCKTNTAWITGVVAGSAGTRVGTFNNDSMSFVIPQPFHSRWGSPFSYKLVLKKRQ